MLLINGKMISQYPHIIEIELNPTSPILKNGEWVFGTSSPVVLECRAEPNGSGTIKESASGQLVVYSYLVYLGKLEYEIPFGTKCKVVYPSSKEVEMTVLRHENGQLNSRIWL